MKRQALGDFLVKLLFLIFNLQGEYYVLGAILPKALIYGGYFRFPKSWCRQHFNWLSYFTEFGI